MNQNVEQTLSTMFQNWPSLYETRLSALNRVFTYARWTNGLPVMEDTMTRNDSPLMDESERVEKVLTVEEQLHIRRENHQRSFIMNNAELLARNPSSKFSYVPSFSSHNLNRIPNNISPEWRAALVEFCKAILDYTDCDLKKRLASTPSVIENELTRLAIAKTVANEALCRFAPELVEDVQKEQRAQKLHELQYAAEKLGMRLVPITFVD